jgi:hypothetical protein
MESYLIELLGWMTVVEASDPQEALAVAKKKAEHFSFSQTDTPMAFVPAGLWREDLIQPQDILASHISIASNDDIIWFSKIMKGK